MLTFDNAHILMQILRTFADKIVKISHKTKLLFFLTTFMQAIESASLILFEKNTRLNKMYVQYVREQ